MNKKPSKRKCPYCGTYSMVYCCDTLPRSMDTTTLYEHYLCVNHGCGHYHIVGG